MSIVLKGAMCRELFLCEAIQVCNHKQIKSLLRSTCTIKVAYIIVEGVIILFEKKYFV